MDLKYSVIVPIYKVEKYLNKCIDSILAQTYKNFELLLIDDGSPDRCPQICDEYAALDKRVRVIHKKNGGLVSARNVGIEEARGEYICYVDGDDWIDEKLLESVYEKALRIKSPDVVIFGIVKKFANRDEEIFTDLKDGFYDKNQLKNEVYPYMMYDNRKPFCQGLIFPAACNKIYKRSLLKEHYCEDLKIRMGEDNAFVYEMLWYAESIYIYNKIFYYYNQLNPGAMNQSYDLYRFENNKRLFDYMGGRLENINNVLDEQFNAFKAYWITMAVFHEIKSGHGICEAAKHIRKSLKHTKLMSYVKLKGLPKVAQIFMMMLKLKLYILTLVGVKIIQNKRNK